MLTGSGGEFYALREYLTGDDLRRVHWASSARLGKLVIRQEQSPSAGRATVGVDLRAVGWTAPSLEVGLSCAASIATSALAEGWMVRLLTGTGVDTGFGSGRDQLGRILDALAAARAAPGEGNLAAALSGEEGAVLIAPAVTRSAGGLAPAGRRGPLTVIAVDPSGEAQPSVARSGRGSGTRVAFVGQLGDLPLAWSSVTRAGAGAGLR
ncbi:MAG: DUF58 domain-containing protein [Acidimicrobiales bacterium]